MRLFFRNTIDQGAFSITAHLHDLIFDHIPKILIKGNLIVSVRLCTMRLVQLNVLFMIESLFLARGMDMLLLC